MTDELKPKRVVSEETRQKMRLAKLGKKRGPYKKHPKVDATAVVEPTVETVPQA